MPTYKLPVFYEMYGTIEIEANTLNEAIEKSHSFDVGLPKNASYVDDSFTVDIEKLFEDYPYEPHDYLNNSN